MTPPNTQPTQLSLDFCDNLAPSKSVAPSFKETDVLKTPLGTALLEHFSKYGDIFKEPREL